uniref:S-adenosylmethionine mitochondrial carrier protein n=1 Tax=Ditylenchus dipsaci TaxID=166011 RepID=A0A915DUK4_9BILA
METNSENLIVPYKAFRYLACGAVAGMAVDLSLYPLDTIKTRVQSKQGFKASGGFKHIYRGMSSVALGSAPGSAIFFLTYSSTKRWIENDSPLCDAFRASLAKSTDSIRPTIFYRCDCHGTIFSQWIRGFYKGYASTVFREIPFSFIEFPVWECLKRMRARQRNKQACTPLESAICGSLAGSLAAAITTPLDVVKTRIMLDRRKEERSIKLVMSQILKEEGVVKLYSGVLPRSIWMGVGGFIFFFAYEFSLKASLANWR